MKKCIYTLLFVFLAGSIIPVHSQILKRLGEKITNSVEQTLQEATDKQTESVSVAPTSGKAYYVSASKGSNRNDGSKAQPFKDLQKAINTAPEGATIYVSEGNYLGNLDQGYIEVKKYISLIGGYSEDFSQWNPIKYITSIRPTEAQAGTSGSRGLMDIYVRGNRNGVILVDGFTFDKGQMNRYCKADPSNPVSSTPEGCETGRRLNVGESPSSPAFGVAIDQQLLHGDVEGQVTIRNCTFLNGQHFAIQMGCIAEHFEIYNNVFVANRMASCEVRGMNSNPDLCTINFHHNTVLFTWCRTKVMEDMGYGYRFMTGIHGKVYNNIFGGNNLGALDRTYIETSKEKEAKRETSAYNNLFFMNKADLVLPSGGGKWALVAAKNFEDVEQLRKYENNKEMTGNDNFVKAIDQAYLKGFAGINVKSSQSYDPNSAANQWNRTFGLNQTGTEIVRASMYANRYPFEKAFLLFGKVKDYGAQIPVKP